MPSTSSSININPAGVPVDEGFGLEAIVFDGVDFALITGTGRVGAAISPSNDEEGFFGPPGLEPDPEYLERKMKEDKYKSPKINFATGFNVYNNKKKDLKQFRLNLGVIAKYNRVSNEIFGGGGVNAIIGPLTLGYAANNDKYVLEKEKYGLPEDMDIPYDTQSFSVGIFLNSLAVDYSELRMDYGKEVISNVSLLTASVFVHRFILTASRRREDSFRPRYDFGSQMLEYDKIKYEHFGGVQMGVTKTIMFGVFYNYYLLREISFGLTLFI